MVTIRSAVRDDVADLVALWAREGGPTSLPCGQRELERLLGRDAEATVVAVDDGRLVGSLIVGWDGWRCHLYRLAVEASARRRGVATALLAAAHDRAARLGAARLDATVHPDNAPAIAFWKAAGFDVDVYGRWSRLV